MAEFEGNSHSDRRPQRQPRPDAQPERTVEKKVSGQVIRRKQPLSKRFREHFFPSQDQSVGDYVFFGVMLPAAQEAISRAVSEGIDLILFGETHRRRGRSSGGRTQYRTPSRGEAPWSREDPREPLSRRARTQHQFAELVIPDRVEAQDVLEELWAQLERHDQVTVGDYYDAVGVTKEFTDENWGWTDLQGTRILRAGRDGYVIDLPPTESLRRGR